MLCYYRAVAYTSQNYVTITSVWQKSVSGMAETSECQLSEIYFKLEAKAKAHYLEKITCIRNEDPFVLRKTDFSKDVSLLPSLR